jgi:hypothetical protein
MANFGQKLELALKILLLSRVGLAAAIGVDKSVAGRWVSGKVHPSAHNLALISQLIAKKVPGFSMLDWDRDYDDFASFLGGSQVSSNLSKTIWPLLPPKMSAEATYAAQERTAAYEGLWRTTRPSSDLPGEFLHDVSIVRRDENGFLTFLSGVEGFYYEGTAVMVNQQLYYFAADDTFGAISMGILNGVPRGRAEVVDGVILTTLRDAGASPASSGIHMQRIGDLTEDVAADDARFRELVENQKMLASPGSVPTEVANALHNAANAPGMLRMLFTQSLSRGPIIQPS